MLTFPGTGFKIFFPRILKGLNLVNKDPINALSEDISKCWSGLREQDKSPSEILVIKKEAIVKILEFISTNPTIKEGTIMGHLVTRGILSKEESLEILSIIEKVMDDRRLSASSDENPVDDWSGKI